MRALLCLQCFIACPVLCSAECYVAFSPYSPCHGSSAYYLLSLSTPIARTHQCKCSHVALARSGPALQSAQRCAASSVWPAVARRAAMPARFVTGSCERACSQAVNVFLCRRRIQQRAQPRHHLRKWRPLCWVLRPAVPALTQRRGCWGGDTSARAQIAKTVCNFWPKRQRPAAVPRPRQRAPNQLAVLGQTTKLSCAGAGQVRSRRDFWPLSAHRHAGNLRRQGTTQPPALPGAPSAPSELCSMSGGTAESRHAAAEKRLGPRQSSGAPASQFTP